MIGPLYVHFVPVFDPLCPIGLVLCACIHCTYCIHACAKNNTIFTTTCLYIPMHSHNLSLVDKCVIKLSYFA